MSRTKKIPVLSPRMREISRKVNQAVREALLDHHRAGNPVAIWQDGKVVIVPPSKIPELIEFAQQE